MSGAGVPLHGDVLDLRIAWQWVWRARLVVMAVTVATMALSAWLAWTVVPVQYETRVQVLPPRPADLSAYALAHQLTSVVVGHAQADQDAAREPDAIAALSVEQAYRMFLRHLTSAQLRDRFLMAHVQAHSATTDTPRSRERLRRQLDQAVRIVLPDARTSQHQWTTLIWRGADPEQIAVWANTYVAWAMEAACNELLADLRSEIQMRRQAARTQVEVLRQSGAVERRFEIERVDEALTIAQRAGLVGPAQGIWILESALQAQSYLQGSQALQAQRDVLLAREEDEPYIAQLSSVRHRQALLESLAAQSLSIQVASWDARAQVPTEPIGPARWVWVLGGAVLGLLLGLGWAVGRGAWFASGAPHTARTAVRGG
ncbi:hypothetical protein B7P02_15655 [Bordetella bronchiseptica]|uniref:Wzz/FepE/Etk N-terminal domain-containing protein n=1 Tax=Bordetella bronchiseptica TaxID=518 RepID=UPI000D730D25|nr:Wzz/FepE/Etk N-terminal domain-containing protein [Bordetella bronchiseptica]AWP59361.1 hypothetical protein B7P02_15655 [Bordetella bronchiseptica]